MRLGRHSRRRYDWGTEPPRSAELADAVAAEETDPTKRAPGRKDRRNRCKPRHGSHSLVAVARMAGGKPAACKWLPAWDMKTRGWKPAWNCSHEVVCEACGKWFRFLYSTECPDWHPLTDTEANTIKASVEEMEARRAHRRAAARPAVNGPKGYRRRRASG